MEVDVKLIISGTHEYRDTIRQGITAYVVST